MSDSAAKILFSVLLGGAGFLALLVPALVLQYRRFGRPSLLRLLGTAAACVYTVGLIAFTLFPLPTVADACGARTGAILQPIPLHFLVDIADEAAATSWSAAMTSFAVMQVVLNVVLFVPLGALLRRLAGRRLGTAVLIGLAVSLAIEATQYTGIWGIYPCGFRVADVDDLIANTLGAWAGAVIAPRLLGWMPQARALVAHRPPAVTGPRRLLGMLLDWLLIGAVEISLLLAVMLVRVLRASPDAVQVPPAGGVQLGIAAVAAFVVVVLVPALLGTGASLGQRLVGIAPVWEDALGPTLGRRLTRTLPVAGVCTAGGALPSMLMAAGVPILPSVIDLVCWAVLAVAVVWAARGDHRGLSGAVSGARMVDVRALARPRR